MNDIFPNKSTHFHEKLYSIEHGTPLKAPGKPNRKPHLSLYRRNYINDVEIIAPDLYCNITLLLFLILSWKWQSINYHWLNKFLYKSIYNHLIFLNLAVRIVFQFRKRCTLPTCIMGHHARDCWRRFWAYRFSSACSVIIIIIISEILFIVTLSC